MQLVMVSVERNLKNVETGDFKFMNFFSKNELKIVGSILFIISFISFFNFRLSIRRARDNQRKNDLTMLKFALGEYNRYMGAYPLSSDNGKIIACKGNDTYFDEVLKTWVNLRACDWGKDNLVNISDSDIPIFISPIPIDPKNMEGISFTYLSDGARCQLLAYLEGVDEAEFDPIIQKRNINCGNKICNFGIAPGNTPLDISLEEYENQLLEKEILKIKK